MIDLVGLASVEDLLKFVREYGNTIYLFAFVFAFARTGFLPPLLAGYAAHGGALDPAWTLGVFWIGSALGDELRFYIGRRWGLTILEKVPSLKRPVEIVIGILNAYPIGFMLTYRFARGARSAAAIALGMTPIPHTQFSLFNVIGAGLWSGVFVGAGYMLGNVSEKLVGDYANWASLALLGLFVLVGWLISRRLELVAARSAKATPAR
jgi:membrane protein DedA with SNARE-associated domain